MNYDLYAYCCYFELYEQISTILNKHLKYVVSVGHIIYDTMFIAINFLSGAFSVTMNSCVTTYIHKLAFKLTLVLWKFHFTCCVLIY